MDRVDETIDRSPAEPPPGAGDARWRWRCGRCRTGRFDGPRAPIAQNAAPAAAPGMRPAPGAPPPPAPRHAARAARHARRARRRRSTAAESASAVVVDGVPYLVDCGYGACARSSRRASAIQPVSTLFLTHLHDDHTSDIAALLSHPVDGQQDDADRRLRAVRHRAARRKARSRSSARTSRSAPSTKGRDAQPEALYHGHDVAATASRRECFADERVVVTAAESTHFPERATSQMPHRALAYRFDTKAALDRVLGRHGVLEEPRDARARCGCLRLRGDGAERLRTDHGARERTAAARATRAASSRHVAETHSTPADVGRMAAEARSRPSC